MRVDAINKFNYAISPQPEKSQPPATENQEKETVSASEYINSYIMQKKIDRETKQTDKLEEMRNNYILLADQLHNLNEQGKASAEAAEIKQKCLTIAMRIMSGDDVPADDYRFLLEKDPELYGKAIIMRMQKENPAKHKRLSKDEDFDDSIEIAVGGSSGSAGNDAGVDIAAAVANLAETSSTETTSSTTE